MPTSSPIMRLKLEDRLVLAEIGVGVAAVRGQELGAAVDLVADGRNVVLPAAAAEKADHVDVVGVLIAPE